MLGPFNEHDWSSTGRATDVGLRNFREKVDANLHFRNIPRMFANKDAELASAQVFAFESGTGTGSGTGFGFSAG
jgi:hypothetical protein